MPCVITIAWSENSITAMDAVWLDHTGAVDVVTATVKLAMVRDTLRRLPARQATRRLEYLTSRAPLQLRRHALRAVSVTVPRRHAANVADNCCANQKNAR